MRSYALALLAASGSAAFPASYNSGKTAAAVTFSADANYMKNIAAGATLKWGYDAAKVYVTFDAVGTAVTAMAKANTDMLTVGVRVKVGVGAMIMGCSWKSATATTAAPTWHAYEATSQAAVTANTSAISWIGNGSMTKDSTANTTATVSAVTDAKTVTNAVLKKTGETSILTTSSSMLDSTRKVVTCHVDVMREIASANMTKNQVAAAGLNKINSEFVQVFGHTLTGSVHKTKYGNATFFNYTPTAAVAVASGASKFSIAAGQTVAGLVVTHSVNAWTATAVVYVEYEWKMTLTAALTASAKNSATTCSKIATAVWQCAIMETTGTALSSSIGVVMKFKAYRSDAALAFTSGLPETTANLGKVANVIKEYEMTNVAAGSPKTAAIPSLTTGFVGTMLQSNKWAWYAAGNTMDTTFKIFTGKTQYFSTEADAAAATAVVTAVTAYAPTAWVGACLGSTCLYGAKALAAVASASGSGSLGLASVGAAIVLAMAF